MLRLVVVLLLLTTGACTKKSTALNESILVKVNDESLSAKAFAALLAEGLRDFDSLTVKDEKVVRRIKNNIVHEFIVKTISAQWAKDNNIFVKSEELEAEINSTRSFYPDDLAFRRALSNEKLSYEEWRDRLKSSLLERKVLTSLGHKITPPSEEDLKNYYKNNLDDFKKEPQIQLRQIVLSTESDAKRIHAELTKGKNFSTLARNFSIAPEATKDGLVGWVEKGTLELFDGAFNLRPGQVSSVLKSPYGFHILRVDGKRGARALDYNEARASILQRLMAKREQAAYSVWLENQIRQSKVFKDEGLIKSLSVETRSE